MKKTRIKLKCPNCGATCIEEVAKAMIYHPITEVDICPGYPPHVYRDDTILGDEYFLFYRCPDCGTESIELDYFYETNEENAITT